MSERTVRGGIESGASEEAIEQTIDPELVDDTHEQEEDVEAISLPDYDPDQFELPDDYEYDGEDED